MNYCIQDTTKKAGGVMPLAFFVGSFAIWIHLFQVI